MVDNNNFSQEINEEIAAFVEKRKKSLLKYKVKEENKLIDVLMSLTKTELDDIRINLGVGGTSSLKKQELADALAGAILNFAPNWLANIENEQYELLNKIVQSETCIKGDIITPSQVDYLNSIGIVFSGSKDKEHYLFIPEELKEIFKNINNKSFKKKVLLNNETVRLATGILFYYGYLDYEQLYEMVTRIINKKEISLDRFVGVLINGSCWQDEIITLEFGAQHINVVNLEELIETQLEWSKEEFRPLSYEEIYQAGQPGYVVKNQQYLQMEKFLAEKLNVSIEEVNGFMQDIIIMIMNEETSAFIFDYMQDMIAIPNQKIAKQLSLLLLELYNSVNIFKLKGYTLNELDKMMGKTAKGLVVSKARGKDNVIRVSFGEKTAGRNEPCPCGSGKKYKKCCMIIKE